MATIEAHKEVRDEVLRKKQEYRNRQMEMITKDRPKMTDWKGAHEAAAKFLGLPKQKVTRL